MVSPGGKPTGEGAVQTFPSPVIGDFLLPDWDEAAIVADVGVEGWERSTVDDVGRLAGLEIGFEGSTRALGCTHGEGCCRLV